VQKLHYYVRIGQVLDDIQHHNGIERRSPGDKLLGKNPLFHVEPARTAESRGGIAQFDPLHFESRFRLGQEESIRTTEFEQLSTAGAGTTQVLKHRPELRPQHALVAHVIGVPVRPSALKILFRIYAGRRKLRGQLSLPHAAIRTTQDGKSLSHENLSGSPAFAADRAEHCASSAEFEGRRRFHRPTKNSTVVLQAYLF